MRKLLLFFVLMLMIGCNTSQSVVRTTKPYKKTTPATTRTAGRTVKKPATTAASKPVAVKTTPKKTTSQKTIPQKSVPQKTNPQVVTVAKKAEEIPNTTTSDIKKIEEKYESAIEEDKSSSTAAVYSKTEILEATTRVKVTTAMVLDYIAQYRETAQSNMRQYGIPSSIILGQGILESGAGTGPLSILANNHFGIKCHKDWNGQSIRYDDDEEQECFRKYDAAMESFADHSQFLINRPWYSGLFELEKDDYKQWAKGLKAAGYATDPKYPEKLIAIIERYQLGKYDAEVLGKEYVATNPPKQNTSFASAADMYQVTQGDTLYSISKRFNISIDELKRKNNMQDNALSIGQNLKVK